MSFDISRKVDDCVQSLHKTCFCANTSADSKVHFYVLCNEQITNSTSSMKIRIVMRSPARERATESKNIIRVLPITLAQKLLSWKICQHVAKTLCRTA